MTFFFFKQMNPVEVPKAQQRLTIFQKMEIVRYALKLAMSKEVITTRIRKKSAPKKRRFRKGMNIQRQCEIAFPILKGVKVCKLIKQSEQQKWREMPEREQKRTYMVKDSWKATVGQTNVRGWKCLTHSQICDRLETCGKIPRWNVPGPVLEDAGCFVSCGHTSSKLGFRWI